MYDIMFQIFYKNLISKMNQKRKLTYKHFFVTTVFKYDN